MGKDPGLLKTLDSATDEWGKRLNMDFHKADAADQMLIIADLRKYLVKRGHGRINRMDESQQRTYAASLWNRLGRGKMWRDKRENCESNYFSEMSCTVFNPKLTALTPVSLGEILENCNCCIYFEVPEPSKNGFTIATKELSKDRKKVERTITKHYVEAANYRRLRSGDKLKFIMYNKDGERHYALNALENALHSQPSFVPEFSSMPARI